ncbi:hypothetical protein CYMTET_33616, partial [Cymbomonas tetramitiformis]
DGYNAQDLNAAHRSISGEYVVTADNYGSINLFNCPCVVETAPCRTYGGHSSFVMCVRFSCDDRRVITAGGRDRAIFMFESHAMAKKWEWRKCEQVTFPLKHPNCDMEECTACGTRPPPPLPAIEWRMLDDKGTMGWFQPPRPLKWPDEMTDEDEPDEHPDSEHADESGLEEIDELEEF